MDDRATFRQVKYENKMSNYCRSKLCKDFTNYPVFLSSFNCKKCQILNNRERLLINKEQTVTHSTDKKTDRQTDKFPDRQTDKHTDRYIDRQTYR